MKFPTKDILENIKNNPKIIGNPRPIPAPTLVTPRPVNPKTIDPVRPAVMPNPRIIVDPTPPMPNPGKPVIPPPVMPPQVMPKPPRPHIDPMPPRRPTISPDMIQNQLASMGSSIGNAFDQSKPTTGSTLEQMPQLMPPANNTSMPANTSVGSYKKGGSAKNYTTKDGKINLGSGRVSTSSKNKSNSNW